MSRDFSSRSTANLQHGIASAKPPFSPFLPILVQL
jgi:hypothetical protein